MDLWCKRNDTEEDPYEYCAAFNVSLDFTSIVNVTEDMRLTLKMSNLYMYFNSVIETKVGSFSLFYLNLSISGAIIFVQIIINSYLAVGLDLNWVVKDVLGISFMYFREF